MDPKSLRARTDSADPNTPELPAEKDLSSRVGPFTERDPETPVDANASNIPSTLKPDDTEAEEPARNSPMIDAVPPKNASESISVDPCTKSVLPANTPDPIEAEPAALQDDPISMSNVTEHLEPPTKSLAIDNRPASSTSPTIEVEDPINNSPVTEHSELKMPIVVEIADSKYNGPAMLVKPPTYVSPETLATSSTKAFPETESDLLIAAGPATDTVAPIRENERTLNADPSNASENRDNGPSKEESEPIDNESRATTFPTTERALSAITQDLIDRLLPITALPPVETSAIKSTEPPTERLEPSPVSLPMSNSDPP